MVTSMKNVNVFIISDYIPYLGFITELQGWRKTFERIRDWTYDVAKGLLEIEKHKQRAKEGTDDSYVPDFLDLLLRTPLADGKTLPEKNLAQVILIVSVLPQRSLDRTTQTPMEY